MAVNTALRRKRPSRFRRSWGPISLWRLMRQLQTKGNGMHENQWSEPISGSSVAKPAGRNWNELKRRLCRRLYLGSCREEITVICGGNRPSLCWDRNCLGGLFGGGLLGRIRGQPEKKRSG